MKDEHKTATPQLASAQAQHSALPWRIGNDGESAPNTRHIIAADGSKVATVESFPSRTTGKADAELITSLGEFLAHESERKTVHQWLNDAGIVSEENSEPICLLRRLRIACDKLNNAQRLADNAKALAMRVLQSDFYSSAKHETDDMLEALSGWSKAK